MDGWGDDPAASRVDIAYSRDFAAWLAECRIAFALSTGDGRLVLVGAGSEGKPSLFVRAFDATFGLAAGSDSLVLATAFQIWRFENAVPPGRDASGYDKLFVPRIAYTTGEVRAGDVAEASGGEILFANTVFSCVAAASDEFSFTPLWRPPFVSRLAPEDRCHLGGLALESGRLRYVAVAAASDEAGGWARRIGSGGLVIDAGSDSVVARGLALPVSPRLEGGGLWLCESASGALGRVHVASGVFEEIAFCPGWLGGLAFADGFAAVTTSASRDGRGVGGLPLEHNLHHYRARAQTALCIVDLAQGEVAHWLRFDGLQELRDVAAIPDSLRPAALGLAGEDIRRVLSIGPDRSLRGERNGTANAA